MPSIKSAHLVKGTSLDFDPSVDDAANAAELGTASDPEPDNANVANKKKKKKKNKNKKKSVARANDLDAKV